MDLTSYKSSLLNSKNRYEDSSNFLTPVVVRFNPKILNNSLRRSLSSFKDDKKLNIPTEKRSKRISPFERLSI